MAYQPIENYGVIGNMRTTAHVGIDGSIDWFCFPYFDSPSIFAAILDQKKGGTFQISPSSQNITYKQFYWPDTNILVTRFHSPDGMAEVIDYMPAGEAAAESGTHELVRRINVVHGSLPFRVHCKPAFNYGRDEHSIELVENGACFHSPKLSMALTSRIPMRANDNAATAEFVLKDGEVATFTFHQVKPGEGCGFKMSEEAAHEHFKKTVEFWRH